MGVLKQEGCEIMVNDRGEIIARCMGFRVSLPASRVPTGIFNGSILNNIIPTVQYY